MVYTKIKSKWNQEFNSSTHLRNAYQAQIYELDYCEDTRLEQRARPQGPHTHGIESLALA